MSNQLSIKALKLINYRCFEQLDVTFDERMTVLIGSNGGGKSAILDAIAIAFGPFIGAFDESVGKHFSSSDIRLSKVRNTESKEMEYADGGVELVAKGCVPGAFANSFELNDTWSRRLVSPKNSKTTIKDSKDLIEYGKSLQSGVKGGSAEVVLPLVAYYGTGRLWHQRHHSDRKLSRTSRTIGYADCLDPASSYKLFSNWFEYWSINAQNERLKAFEKSNQLIRSEFDDFIVSVSGAVDTCLDISGWSNISYSLSAQEIVVRHDQFGELPVKMLSDGIRNMIGMVADIAFRSTKLNPQLGSEAALKTPGIVLIDEVDMHLHPEWQQVVLTNLRKAFPNMQFIVTTHSPQVLSSVRKENIRVLGRNSDGTAIAEPPIDDTYGRESNLVMHRAMDVDPSPPFAEKRDLERLINLIDSGLYDSEEVKALFDKLKQSLGASHPQITQLERSIHWQEALKKL
ncbi:ATP-binding protein [Pseudidiomarina aestuarii]|uniref:ATP-binding protein n=1 Tax=Pseudidiomarina aestuarii TaxID=624146 RepID=A0A2T4D5Y8_9GAMM|nr:ATP-binding protein [Pseudidiomarina aestuarii]